ncbi:MAG: LysR family transcriptional regulator [Planctomycetes bacterium]|nr:LysR family transcriptional regulator [Planctomycetota bacterium]
MTLSELRYAVALAEERHFGRAAARCHVTQPTLSAQLMKLERTLGVSLFERSPRGVSPTAIGAAVVEQAREVLEGAERMLELAREGQEPLSGVLRLGVIPTLSPYLLPWLARPLAKSFPELKLVFRELKTDDIVAELEQHRLDCGLLALPVPSGLVTDPLFDEPFFWLVPAKHAAAGKKSVRESDLESEPVLLLEEGHCLRDQALKVCERAHTQSEHAEGDFRATSIETLRQMVAAGMGTTLVPALALIGRERGGKATVALPFAAPAPTRKMALGWRGTHPRGKDHRLLAQWIREHLPEGVQAIAGKRG